LHPYRTTVATRPSNRRSRRSRLYRLQTRATVKCIRSLNALTRPSRFLPQTR
jgi:hypothetical protein